MHSEALRPVQTLGSSIHTFFVREKPQNIGVFEEILPKKETQKQEVFVSSVQYINLSLLLNRLPAQEAAAHPTALSSPSCSGSALSSASPAVCTSDSSLITLWVSHLCPQPVIEQKWGAGGAATPRQTLLLVALGSQETLLSFLALSQAHDMLEGKSCKVNFPRAQFSLVKQIFEVFAQELHPLCAHFWSSYLFTKWPSGSWRHPR